MRLLCSAGVIRKAESSFGRGADFEATPEALYVLSGVTEAVERIGLVVEQQDARYGIKGARKRVVNTVNKINHSNSP